MKVITTIIDLYIDGFRNLKVGKKLWLIIGLKLFIMLAILKVFFFPNVLYQSYNNDEARSNHVMQHLIKMR